MKNCNFLKRICAILLSASVCLTNCPTTISGQDAASLFDMQSVSEEIEQTENSDNTYDTNETQEESATFTDASENENLQEEQFNDVLLNDSISNNDSSYNEYPDSEDFYEEEIPANSNVEIEEPEEYTDNISDTQEQADQYTKDEESEFPDENNIITFEESDDSNEIDITAENSEETNKQITSETSDMVEEAEEVMPVYELQTVLPWTTITIQKEDASEFSSEAYINAEDVSDKIASEDAFNDALTAVYGEIENQLSVSYYACWLETVGEEFASNKTAKAVFNNSVSDIVFVPLNSELPVITGVFDNGTWNFAMPEAGWLIAFISIEELEDNNENTNIEENTENTDITENKAEEVAIEEADNDENTAPVESIDDVNSEEDSQEALENKAEENPQEDNEDSFYQENSPGNVENAFEDTTSTPIYTEETAENNSTQTNTEEYAENNTAENTDENTEEKSAGNTDNEENETENIPSENEEENKEEKKIQEDNDEWENTEKSKEYYTECEGTGIMVVLEEGIDGFSFSAEQCDSNLFINETAEALGLSSASLISQSVFFKLTKTEPEMPDVKLSAVQVATDMADSANSNIEVVQVGESGIEVIPSVIKDGIISFTPDAIGLFGICRILPVKASDNSEIAEITVYGEGEETEETLEAEIITEEPEKGIEIASTVSVSGMEGPLFAEAKLVDEDMQDSRETASIYAINDGRLSEPIMEQVTSEANVTEIPENADGIAVVLDSGFREKELTVNPDETSSSDASVVLKGMMPKEASAEVFETTIDSGLDSDFSDEGILSGTELILAYEISMYDGDDEYQPNEENPISVTVNDARIEKLKNLRIVHIADDGSVSEVKDFDSGEGFVRFEATGFSVYAIVSNPDLVATDTSWRSISDLDEFAALAQEGVYPAHATGYYFTNEQIDITSTRTGIRKTSRATNPESLSNAAMYYFTPVTDGGGSNRYVAYCYDANGGIQYVKQTGNSLSFTNEENATVFTISMYPGEEKTFQILGTGGYYWNMRGGTSGNAFAAWNAENDPNAMIKFDVFEEVEDDPYNLEGKSYGLICSVDGALGKALDTSTIGTGIGTVSLIVRNSPSGNGEKQYIAQDSEIPKWTFENVEKDIYRIYAYVDGTNKYIKMDGATASITDDVSEASEIKVIPGTGSNEGKIHLYYDGKRLRYNEKNNNSSNFTPAAVNDSNQYIWFNLIDDSQFEDRDFVLYAAKKVSVSDTEHLQNDSRVVVYTRVWNDDDKKYELYAVGPEGALERVYEDGDEIKWAGSRITRLVWDFTEYYYEGTETPNGYYELQNPYSGLYLAPQVENGQILSENPVGINMNGRRYGDYYTTIIAWDNKYYSYAGIKADSTFSNIEQCLMNESGDFYFAVLNNVEEETGELHTIETIDHTTHGITMKIVNFDNITARGTEPNSVETSKKQLEVMGTSVNTGVTQNLVSTDLKENGYPVSTITGKSLYELFEDATEVNYLFPAGTYSTTGYFDYDSTKNFAQLGDNGRFTVYEEIATMDGSGKPSLLHGQFMPFNSISEGIYASVNRHNLYDALLNYLPDEDPRKYERLFLVQNPDYYFGAEIEANFVQTPSGLDKWNNDIVYEFTGDDDFWLYIDGELVINLGGIHSAFEGKVNYRTGKVVVNGQNLTLKGIFESNYRTRNPEATNEEVEAWLDEKFEMNDDGEWVFKDYSSHTMKALYMERGAGASNLHMKFNLTSIEENHVLLSKAISGTNEPDYALGEYAYQIYYRMEGSQFERLGPETVDSNPSVVFKNTNIPVNYAASWSPPGGTTVYEDVFIITPGEYALISLPEGTVEYYVVECGVDSAIYDAVSINGTPITNVTQSEGTRNDYACVPSSVKSRPMAAFDNHVSGSALRTLTIEKKVVNASDGTPVTEDDGRFNFRLYLGTDSTMSAAFLKDYHVKNNLGEYCYWDGENGCFVSSGENDFSSLSESNKIKATFTTSTNGAISNIPAGYMVEVKNLLVGTKFRVEERSNEIPRGYEFLEYQRDAGSYIVEEGDEVNSGTIRSNQSPAIAVVNKKGFGFIAEKEWSDKTYVQDRPPIYLAVYANGTLVSDSVRELAYPKTEAYWYFDSLATGLDQEDYEIYEVIPAGNFSVDSDGVVSGYTGIQKLNSGDVMSAVVTSTGISEQENASYVVSYERDVPHELTENIKKDNIINSRKGIKIEKIDMVGNPLSGAEFTIEDPDGTPAGAASYVSGTNGLVTEAYLRPNIEYTISEIKSPSGYLGIQTDILLTVDENGLVSVTGASQNDYVLTQGDSSHPATIKIKNKPITLTATKKDEDGEPLANAVFALYKQVESNTGEAMKDYNPIPGFETIETAADGTIPQINESLPAGSYYLCETSAPTGFLPVDDILISISTTGVVTAQSTDSNYVSFTQEDNNGFIAYELEITDPKDEEIMELVVNELVEGSMGNRTKNFTFTIDINDYNEMVEWTKNGEDMQPIASGGTFEMAHGDTVIFHIPKNKRVTISQDEEYYTVTVSRDGADAAAKNSETVVLSKRTELTFLDVLNMSVPTAIPNNDVTYLLIFAAGIMFLLIFCLRRRN